MLRGVVFSDVRRVGSGPAVAGVAMCSGSLLLFDLRGAGVFAFAVGEDGVGDGGSRVAALGVALCCTAAVVEACEGVRDIMVGTGVGFGAGRV